MSEFGIAGQVTLTQGAFARSDFRCKSLARISLPVPLSPWSSTGMVVGATRSNLALAISIRGVRPKMTSTGGNSRISKNSFGCTDDDLSKHTHVHKQVSKYVATQGRWRRKNRVCEANRLF